MRFAWFILIYCFLVKANGDTSTEIATTPTTPTNKIVSTNRDLNNQTKIQSDLKVNELTKSAKDLDSNSTNASFQQSKPTDQTSKKQSKANKNDKNDLLSALPSTASLTTLPIRADVVHKSIPIQVIFC